jgi:Uma2 family endonuclease
MAAMRTLRLSAQEYLARERLAEFRSEFYSGEIFAMAGGSPSHSLIRINTGAQLSVRLRGRPCTAYDSDLRILIAASGLYTYPDLSVICGEIQFDDKMRDTALNPAVLFEVLSESTEAYDRGKKFEHYRRLPTLREYVLIAQDRPQVERFLRNPDDTWTLTVVSGLDATLELPSISVTLVLAEIYDKVDFASQSEGCRK